MSSKAELQARLDELGVEYAKSASKAELEDLVAENEIGSDEPVDDPENPGDEVVPLEGTPVDASIPDEDYVHLGEPNDPPEVEQDDPGTDDDIGVLLDAAPSETLVHDTTMGSARPEDGYAAA